MFHDVLDLIDRQFAFLEEQAGVAFFYALRRSLELLDADARVHVLLAELREEARALVEDFRQKEKAFAERTIEARQRLMAVAPDLEGRKTSSGLDELDLMYTHDGFVGIARGQIPSPSGTKGDHGVRLKILLQHLVDMATGARWQPEPGEPPRKEAIRPELVPLIRETTALRDEHQFACREFEYRLEASPGVALLCLEYLLKRLNPPPEQYIESINDELLEDVLAVARDHAPSVRRLIQAGNKMDEHYAPHIAAFRPLVKRLHQGLQLKVGTARSLRQLLDRFRMRSERHDRERLNLLANQAGTRKKESVLTAELAHWLFDQGLNPFSEVPVAGLRPDLLDPDVDLYVEAKQYEGKEGIKKAVFGGMKQVYVTAARVRGHIDLTEAFLVVFRRGGPAVVLPKQLHANGITTFLMAVDIVPPPETGSREPDLPVTFSEDQLMPEKVEAYSEEEVRSDGALTRSG